MDTDLFQALAVALLGLIALLLLLATVMLSRVRRVIERRLPTDAFAPTAFGEPPVPAGAEPATHTAAEDRAAPAAERDIAAASPVATQTSADEAAAPEGEVAATPSEDEREAARAMAGTGEHEAVVEPAPTAQEPVDEHGELEEVHAGEAASGSQAAAIEDYADEPQEQPFERDGRWWFRRGDELLVYEEQTGQWMPAPTRRAGGPVGEAQGGTGVATERTAAGYGETSTELADEPSSGFWKCPSCGAVNGSTSTSCRMCFTPRP
jgi:hypothetical protein